MRIAWFTPFCESSAIGRYSAVILDELTSEHDITVFATGLGDGAASHRPALPTVPIDGRGGSCALRESLAAFDVAVYNLGNYGPFHGDIQRTLAEHPGVAILHDFSTWGLFWEDSIVARKDPAGWLAQIEYSHGPEAREWGRCVLSLDACFVGSQDAALRYNLARSCVRGALGVVVHGEWVRQAIAPLVPAPVVRIEFPAFLAPPGPVAAPATSDKVRLLTIGMVNPNKAVDLVIEALAHSPFLRDHAEYTIAGSMGHTHYVGELRTLVRRYGLDGVVHFVDRPDDALLHRLVCEADVLVNLRYPHLGECSGSLQEALFHGRPAVVWGHGYYAEFPQDAVVRVGSLAQLAAALERLAASPGERRARGARALEHARGRFCTRRYCRELLPLLEGCCRAAPACRLADRLARRLADCRPDKAPVSLAAKLAHEIDLLSGHRPELLPRKNAA